MLTPTCRRPVQLMHSMLGAPQLRLLPVHEVCKWEVFEAEEHPSVRPASLKNVFLNSGPPALRQRRIGGFALTEHEPTGESGEDLESRSAHSGYQSLKSVRGISAHDRGPYRAIGLLSASRVTYRRKRAIF
jgi:hypothetical protein